MAAQHANDATAGTTVYQLETESRCFVYAGNKRVVGAGPVIDRKREGGKAQVDPSYQKTQGLEGNQRSRHSSKPALGIT